MSSTTAPMSAPPQAHIVWNEDRSEGVIFVDQEPGSTAWPLTAADDAHQASTGRSRRPGIGSALAQAFFEAYEDDEARPILTIPSALLTAAPVREEGGAVLDRDALIAIIMEETTDDIVADGWRSLGKPNVLVQGCRYIRRNAPAGTDGYANPEASAKQFAGFIADRIMNALATREEAPEPMSWVSRVKEVREEGDGFWAACAGCQEGIDGYVSTKDYPYSAAFGCQPGGGCSECGGLGVKWDTTDYDAMAASMLADMAREEAGDIDLYDDKVQAGIAWTMRQWGETLGLKTWTMGDGSESVEGDVGAEIHTILVDAGLRDPETNEMASLRAQPQAREEAQPVAFAPAEDVELLRTAAATDRNARRTVSLFSVAKEGLTALYNTPPAPKTEKVRAAVADIAAERQRQIDVEGRTPDADDGYRAGELAAAASAYAFSAATRTRYLALDPLGFWPWAPEWFKPKDQRSDLVRAGALIVAEIERIDRVQLTADDDNGEADCPICKIQFKADDLCLTDIDLGPCHAECLADSPAVDLDTGEPLPEGASPPTPYRYDMTGQAVASVGEAGE